MRRAQIARLFVKASLRFRPFALLLRPFALLFVLFVVFVVFASGALLGARDARAQQNGEELERRQRADALFRLAEADDQQLSFANALRHFDEARALDPGGRFAPRAEARAAALRGHAEGDFAPLVALERLRRDPALAGDPRAVDALVHDADSFPPGQVRVEVWALAGEAYARRFDRPLEADALFRRVIGDPLGDPVIARKAAHDLVALRLGRGDVAGAREAVRLAGGRGDPLLAREVERMARRRNMHFASIAALVLMGVLALRAWVVARRGDAARARVRTALSRTWKLALAYAAYVAVGGAVLASGYEAGTMRPFLYFGVVLVPIVMVARAWGAAAGGAAVGTRAARAALCGAAALGAALLVLESVDGAFLDGMGL